MRFEWKGATAPDLAGSEPRALGTPRLIQITLQIRILVAVESIDARQGIDTFRLTK
jgi:hypothetical protein